MAHLVEVQDRISEIRLTGADVLVVTQSAPSSVPATLTTLPIACDPGRLAYRAFGLERGRLSMFFRPHVLARYVRLIFSGWFPKSPESGEDLLQLGGDFIVSAAHKLVFAHRSRDPADRPTVGELIHQLQLPMQTRLLATSPSF